MEVYWNIWQIQRLADRLGGRELLAERLGVSLPTVKAWLAKPGRKNRERLDRLYIEVFAEEAHRDPRGV